jgi:hypothetical protein
MLSVVLCLVFSVGVMALGLLAASYVMLLLKSGLRFPQIDSLTGVLPRPLPDRREGQTLTSGQA